MARVTADQYVEKHARRLKGATTDIRNGVQNVTTAPGQRAAQAADRMLTNVTEAVSSGRWAKAVSGVSLEDWKESVLRKGIERIAKGIDEAAPKMQRMAAKLLANVDAAASKVHSMPKGSIDDSINRAAEFMRQMNKTKGQYK